MSEGWEGLAEVDDPPWSALLPVSPIHNEGFTPVKFQTAGWIQHQHEERLGKAVRKTAELSIVSLCTMYLGRDQQNQIVLELLVPNCNLSLLQLSQL